MTQKVATAGRGLVVIGVVLAVIGIATYLVQVAAHRLFVPWYMPATAILGVVLIAASLWQTPTRSRIAALLFVLLPHCRRMGFFAGYSTASLHWAGRRRYANARVFDPPG